MSKKYTVADFFCGCGGFSEGLYQAGFDVVLSLDSWKLAKETHDINHPNCKCIHMDILKLKTEDFDKLIPDTDMPNGTERCIIISKTDEIIEHFEEIYNSKTISDNLRFDLALTYNPKILEDKEINLEFYDETSDEVISEKIKGVDEEEEHTTIWCLEPECVESYEPFIDEEALDTHMGQVHGCYEFLP